jgi:CDP-diacylglycerol pyrophosphatase
VAVSSDRSLRRAAASVGVMLAIACGMPVASADPNALWDIVNGQCVPDQQAHRNPAPCAEVDLDGGELRGHAVLKDLVGATQFLLIPTERIDGIESPEIVASDAPNYFAAAWRARTFVEQRAGRALPRDWLSLAINSADARTQNQLHIHIDCVRADVHQALAAHIGDIGPAWAPFPVPLVGQPYRVMAVWGSELDSVNPFRALADGLTPGDSMGPQTLAVVGITGVDGQPGFAMLAGHAVQGDPNSGSSEDLQDHNACPPPADVIGK